MQINPISLVTVKGASKRVRQPRILTVEQFRLLVSHLREPFNTLALICVCFGLRISEALALKWADVDWLNGTLRVERGIVQQIVDDVKTDDSRKTLTISADLLDVLKAWKQTTQFSARGIGFSLHRSSSEGCLTPIRGLSRKYNAPRTLRALDIFARTHSGTLTGCGLMR